MVEESTPDSTVFVCLFVCYLFFAMSVASVIFQAVVLSHFYRSYRVSVVTATIVLFKNANVTVCNIVS